MEKQYIKIKDVPYIYLDLDIFRGELTEVSNAILNIRNKLKEAYDNRSKNIKEKFTPFESYEIIKIDIAYGSDSDIYINAFRLETDEEYEIRMKREREYKKKVAIANKKRQETLEKRKKEAEKKEFELYQKLKEKYEK